MTNLTGLGQIFSSLVVDFMGKRVILQNRDRELFTFLGEHETATLEQLKLKFWPNSQNSQTAQDRLDKLRKAGYLTRFDHWLDAPTKVSRYQLKRAALKELAAETASNLYTGKPLSTSSAVEAIMGVAARLQLESQGYRVQGWISQRRLQAEQQRVIARLRAQGKQATADQIPDGKLVVVNKSGETALIPVECQGDYSGKMLREKVAGFKGQKLFWATPKKYYGRVVKAANPNITVLLV